jgi:ATP-binding cassette subfamily C exporter for protease/lipase
MKKTSFFARSELTSTLWAFRREFLLVGFFSFVANVLMISPTLYMLQIYDRVLASQSELTLLVMSLLTLGLFAVMSFAEWMRSKVLIDAGVRLDSQLGNRIFSASFDAYLEENSTSPTRAFNDLIQVRQFLTGNGIFAFFDAPWAPIYIAVTFVLHPWLGVLSLIFAAVQAALGWFGHRHTVAPAEEAAKAGADLNGYLQSKLRNTEVIESMGMLGGLRQRWRERHQAWLDQSSTSQGVTHRVVAWSKFIRYSHRAA